MHSVCEDCDDSNVEKDISEVVIAAALLPWSAEDPWVCSLMPPAPRHHPPLAAVPQPSNVLSKFNFDSILGQHAIACIFQQAQLFKVS